MCMLANPCVKTWVIWVVFNCGCVRVDSSSKEGSRIRVYEDSHNFCSSKQVRSSIKKFAQSFARLRSGEQGPELKQKLHSISRTPVARANHFKRPNRNFAQPSLKRVPMFYLTYISPARFFMRESPVALYNHGENSKLPMPKLKDKNISQIVLSFQTTETFSLNQFDRVPSVNSLVC